jgi:hypothetical protein
VTASSGNNYLAEVDYAGRGNSPLQFVRSYNSMDATFLKQNSNSTPELGTTLMGDGWSATYFQSLSSSSVTDVMSPGAGKWLDLLSQSIVEQRLGRRAIGHGLQASGIVVTGRHSGISHCMSGRVIVVGARQGAGNRIQTSGGPAGTVLYWYDEAGHVLGEYDASGNLIEETVWLGDIPVATLRRNGGSVSIYYVHSDQLNTPRQVTRPSDNAQMWSWFSDPFGTDAANENPLGPARSPTISGSPVKSSTGRRGCI